MESSPKNSGLESWFERCSELCSSLTSQGNKFSFSLKLEGSFSFSLQSENAVSPRTKKRRSPSYMRRQQRRKANLLEKRSGSSQAEKAAGNQQPEAAAVDTSSPLNLCPKPVYPRILGSVETEDEYDEIQEWAAGGTVTEMSVLASHSGPENKEEGQDAGSVDRVQEEPPVTPVTQRRLTIDSQGRATPLRTDRKHIVDTSSFRNGGAFQRRIVTVFAPAGVTYDEIVKAMEPSFDCRYLRQTSFRGDKFVYYPPTMHRDACTCSECEMNVNSAAVTASLSKSAY